MSSLSPSLHTNSTSQPFYTQPNSLEPAPQTTYSIPTTAETRELSSDQSIKLQDFLISNILFNNSNYSLSLFLKLLADQVISKIITKPFNLEIALKGGVVTHILSESKSYSDIDIEFTLDSAQSLFMLHSKFKEWAKQNDYFFDAFMLVNDAENQFLILTLPTMPKKVDIRFTYRSQFQAICSYNALRINIGKQIISILNNSQETCPPAHFYTVNGYNLEASLQDVQINQFNCLNAYDLHEGLRAYSLLITKGISPKSLEHDAEFKNRFKDDYKLNESKKPFQNTLLTFVRKHFEDNLKAQLIYLLNFCDVIERSENTIFVSIIQQTVSNLISQLCLVPSTKLSDPKTLLKACKHFLYNLASENETKVKGSISFIEYSTCKISKISIENQQSLYLFTKKITRQDRDQFKKSFSTHEEYSSFESIYISFCNIFSPIRFKLHTSPAITPQSVYDQTTIDTLIEKSNENILSVDYLKQVVYHLQNVKNDEDKQLSLFASFNQILLSKYSFELSLGFYSTLLLYSKAPLKLLLDFSKKYFTQTSVLTTSQTKAVIEFILIYSKKNPNNELKTFWKNELTNKLQIENTFHAILMIFREYQSDSKAIPSELKRYIKLVIYQSFKNSSDTIHLCASLFDALSNFKENNTFIFDPDFIENMTPEFFLTIKNSVNEFKYSRLIAYTLAFTTSIKEKKSFTDTIEHTLFGAMEVIKNSHDTLEEVKTEIVKVFNEDLRKHFPILNDAISMFLKKTDFTYFLEALSAQLPHFNLCKNVTGNCEDVHLSSLISKISETAVEKNCFAHIIYLIQSELKRLKQVKTENNLVEALTLGLFTILLSNCNRNVRTKKVTLKHFKESYSDKALSSAHFSRTFKKVYKLVLNDTALFEELNLFIDQNIVNSKQLIEIAKIELESCYISLSEHGSINELENILPSLTRLSAIPKPHLNAELSDVIALICCALAVKKPGEMRISGTLFNLIHQVTNSIPKKLLKQTFDHSKKSSSSSSQSPVSIIMPRIQGIFFENKMKFINFGDFNDPELYFKKFENNNDYISQFPKIPVTLPSHVKRTQNCILLTQFMKHIITLEKAYSFNSAELNSQPDDVELSYIERELFQSLKICYNLLKIKLLEYKNSINFQDAIVLFKLHVKLSKFAKGLHEILFFTNKSEEEREKSSLSPSNKTNLARAHYQLNHGCSEVIHFYESGGLELFEDYENLIESLIHNKQWNKALAILNYAKTYYGGNLNQADSKLDFSKLYKKLDETVESVETISNYLNKSIPNNNDSIDRFCRHYLQNIIPDEVHTANILREFNLQNGKIVFTDQTRPIFELICYNHFSNILSKKSSGRNDLLFICTFIKKFLYLDCEPFKKGIFSVKKPVLTVMLEKLFSENTSKSVLLALEIIDQLIFTNRFSEEYCFLCINYLKSTKYILQNDVKVYTFDFLETHFIAAEIYFRDLLQKNTLPHKTCYNDLIDLHSILFKAISDSIINVITEEELALHQKRFEKIVNFYSEKMQYMVPSNSNFFSKSSMKSFSQALCELYSIIIKFNSHPTEPLLKEIISKVKNILSSNDNKALVLSETYAQVIVQVTNLFDHSPFSNKLDLMIDVISVLTSLLSTNDYYTIWPTIQKSGFKDFINLTAKKYNQHDLLKPYVKELFARITYLNKEAKLL